MEQNIDDISKIWLPDPELCTAQEALRAEEEWLRKKNGLRGIRPTVMGINKYTHGNKLHPKFFEGRVPPPVALDSMENLEWYEEQLKRCIYGFEYKNQRITGDHYWLLNFTPFLIAIMDSKGHITDEFDIQYPYFSWQHDYIFKAIEEAHYEKKGFMWMSGRGSGKTYSILSIIAKTYHLKPNSHSIVSASHSGHANEAFHKLLIMLDSIANLHPTLALNRLKDTNSLVESGQEVVRDGVKYKEGPRSSIQKVIYGDNPGATRGSRPDIQLMEECLAPDTQILMYNMTYKAIEDIEVGDLTMGVDSKPKYVGRVASGTDEMFEVRQSRGLTYIVNSKHKLYLEERYTANTADEKIITAEEFINIPSDRRKNTTYGVKISGVNAHNEAPFIDPYFLGLWLGDGRSRTDIILVDKEQNNYFINFAKTCNADIKFTNHKLTDKVNYVKLYNKGTSRGYFIKTLKQASLLHNKHIPSIVHLWSKANRLEFLAGLIDSDGWIESNINKTSYNFSFYQKDEQLIDDLTALCVGLGIYTVKRERIKGVYRGFIISLRGQNIKNIPTKLYRKHIPDSWNRQHDALRTASLKIKSIGTGSYNGITLADNDHRLILKDGTITMNCGDWSHGAGNLKSCIGASVGSWHVGSIKKARVFMIGTGGSVSSDQAKDVFNAPDAYDLLAFNDFKPKTCYFLPSHYLLGGQGWEETSVNNTEASKEYLDTQREKKKDDMEIYQKFVQEYPYTIEEVFRKSGTNIFNQRKIAQQWTDLQYEKKNMRPKRGYLEWVKTTTGLIKSVRWKENPEGNIEILEHPFRGETTKGVYNDLYVVGVDSIDMGSLDSTSDKGRSSLAALVKKRIVDGKFFSTTSNLYVAKYIGRSKDVRWDYEEVLKLALYYGAKVNVEYTRIGIVSYFREAKQYHRLIKRPMIALPGAGAGEERLLGLERNGNLIGTPATTYVIDHQDSKIKEYIEDHYDRIFFIDLLEQLRDYQREDRTKYDLVIAMGLCELADEDLLGVAAREDRSETADFKLFGYFTDPRTGRKKFGTLPEVSEEQKVLSTGHTLTEPTWLDLSGKPRFDFNFDVTDASDLKEEKLVRTMEENYI